MNIKQLRLNRDVTVPAATIVDYAEIPEALKSMGIPRPKTVIVLVGGAGGIEWLDKFAMRKVIGTVARLAEQTQSILVDGGTQAGIMTEIGIQRKRNKFSFPLAGVVFDNLLIQQEAKSILDSNHTHFFLIPGDDWGDEAVWISKIATVIAGENKSITILFNGGDISRTDVEFSLRENRPTFVMRGSGRMADEITLTRMVVPIEVSMKPDEMLEILKAKLE